MSKVDFKGSVVLNPVPVVLITSRNKEGKDNVFTVAWTGTICTKPPMLSISVRPERLSYEYIKETMEFTVNLPHYGMVKETDYCGVISGRNEDKIKKIGFTMKPGSNVSVPYIDECPVSIECKVAQIIPLGTHDVILAEVVGSHIDQSIMDESGKIHFEWSKLITYCHGEYYPMAKDAIGKFGFSVAKNEKLKAQYEKYDINYNKLINQDNQASSSKKDKHKETKPSSSKNHRQKENKPSTSKKSKNFHQGKRKKK